MANKKKYVSLDRLSTFLDNLLDNLKAKFAALSHKHTMSDIEDYTVDTELSSASTNPVQNKVLDAEFEAIEKAMKVLGSAIDDKADAEHGHNDVYYTKEEVDKSIGQKTQVQIITWGEND